MGNPSLLRYRAASRDGERGSAADQGAAAIEFALVLPVLVLLVFGIIQFGLAYNTTNVLTHAAREAVRPLALGSGDPVATAKANVPSLDEDLLQVTTSADPCTPGQPASVSLTYPLEYTVPLWGSGTWNLHGSATMRCGG